MATIRLFPFLYTRGRGGTRRGEGLQYLRWCEEVPTHILRAGEGACGYHRPPESTRVSAPEQLPHSLWRLPLPDGWAAFGRSRYAGRQADSRGGNCVVGGFFYEEDSLRKLGFDVFSLLRGGIRFPVEDDLDDGVGPIPPVVIDERSAVAPDETRLQRMVEGLGIGAHLTFALSVASDLTSGRPLVFGLPDCEQHERMLEVLFALLPPGVRCALSFTTYSRDLAGQFHLQGRSGRARDELEGMASRPGSWVMYDSSGEVKVSTALPQAPTPVKAIVRAWKEGGWPGVRMTHHRLRPLGRHLHGAEDLAAAVCDPDLTPGQSLARLWDVPSEHPALPQAAEELVRRGTEQLVAGIEPKECVLFALRVSELGGLVPPPVRARAIETAYERLSGDLGAAYWRGLLRVEAVGSHPDPVVLWSIAARRIRLEAVGASGWDRVLALLARHSPSTIEERFAFLDLVVAVVDRSRGERSQGLWAAATEALARALPPRADDPLERWPAVLAGLLPCLEMSNDAPPLQRLLVGSWLICLRGRVAPADLPDHVFEQLPRLAVQGDEGPAWVGQLGGVLGQHVVREFLLPALLASPAESAIQQAQVYRSLCSVRDGAGLTSEDERIHHLLVQRSWVDALLLELSRRSASPRMDEACTSILQCGRDAVAGRRQAVRRFFRDQVEFHADQASKAFIPGWRVLAVDGSTPAERISELMVEALIGQAHSSIYLLREWTQLGQLLMRLHGQSREDVGWLIRSLESLAAHLDAPGGGTRSARVCTGDVAWAVGQALPRQDGYAKSFIVAVAWVVAHRGNRADVQWMVESLCDLVARQEDPQFVLTVLLSRLLRPGDSGGNTKRSLDLLHGLLDDGQGPMAAQVAKTLGIMIDRSQVRGRAPLPLKVKTIVSQLREESKARSRQGWMGNNFGSAHIRPIAAYLGVDDRWS